MGKLELKTFLSPKGCRKEGSVIGGEFDWLFFWNKNTPNDYYKFTAP